MPVPITVTEILRKFSDYINRVAYRGEHFILMRGKIKVAELRPPPRGCYSQDLRELFGSLSSLKVDLAEFERDLKDTKTKERIKNPWE